jgi:hypothetical protein
MSYKITAWSFGQELPAIDHTFTINETIRYVSVTFERYDGSTDFTVDNYVLVKNAGRPFIVTPARSQVLVIRHNGTSEQVNINFTTDKPDFEVVKRKETAVYLARMYAGSTV